jgi:uncharacterized protein
VAAAGIEAEGRGGQVFSFPVCKFSADHCVYHSHSRDCVAGLSALNINYLPFLVDKLSIVKNFDNKNFVNRFDNKCFVMKNVVGNPARGESFFPRKREIDAIMSKLKDGNNLNIAAPRRIGKTSILFYLLDNRAGDYVYTYIDTEAIDNENDYFKKILKEITKVEEIRQSGRLKSLFAAGHKFLGKIRSLKIGGQGIDFAEDEKVIDYKDDVVNLLSGIELEGDRKLVLLIDEFPQTIQNITDAGKGDITSARHFLQSNRALRLDPIINSKVRFILTGSIGLNHTVAQIACSAFVNDLDSVEVMALNRHEANQLLNELLLAKTKCITPELADYLLDKLEWLIPFHIQLAVQELALQVSSDSAITKANIDSAFDNIIKARNNNHFDHYHSRLKRRFKDIEFAFASTLLEQLAKKGKLTKAETFDLAAQFGLEEKWRNIAEILEYDGYINSMGQSGDFQFNSPIVRMWWQKYVCK